MLTELIALLERVPGTFWGVVIGSFFSLSGVVLTNRASDRRQRAQLAYDRDLKNRERELSLRKDVYLAAAEAISAGLSAVARFADLSVPHDKLTERYVEKSAAIAKVHVIATEDTAKAVAAFSGELGATYLRLSTKRFPLIAQKQRLALLDDQMNRSGAERDRMVGLMKQYSLDGAADPRQWDVQRSYEAERARVDEVVKEHELLNAEFYAKQLDYMTECASESMRLGKLLVPALLAVRAELELPIDGAAYVQIIEQSVSKQETLLKEFINGMRSLPDD